MDSIFGSSDAEFPYPVYTGIWTNWSNGKILGSTLTLTQRNANLLVAFVALFAALVASHLWGIVCFSIHWYLSTSKAQDALYHQRQALLRNNTGAAGSAFILMEMWWAWRRRVSVWRILPLFICTLLLALLFAVASGFSSRIAIGNQVLLLGNNCGAVSPPTDINSTGAASIILPYQADFLTAASIQATQCYSEQEGTGVVCSSAYVKPRISMSVDRNASCPFGSLCQSEYGNIFLDSGFVNSRDDLGVNTPDDQVYSRRRVAHCAPLKTEGYSSIVNLPNNRSYTEYYYGSAGKDNFTYIATNTGYDQSLIDIDRGLNSEYRLSVLRILFRNGKFQSGNIHPIPELGVSGGDLSLIILSANGIQFIDRVSDPWYRATKVEPGSVSYTSNGTFTESPTTFYLQDQPGSPLACTEKWQWCIPSASGQKCTKLGPMFDALTEAFKMADQPATDLVNWIYSQFEIFISAVPNVMRASALLASRKLDAGFQGPLPDTQWQMDVERWFQIALAAQQKVLVDTAAGPSPSMPEEFVKRPSNDVQVNLCNSQKVISNAHISFSVFGLLFILLGGLCIIVAFFIFESVVGFIQRRFKSDPYSRLEWIANGTFQLQRLAHEELGTSEWTGTDEAIPITAASATLAPLDISNPKYPRLLVPVSSRENQPSKEESSIQVLEVDENLTGDSIKRQSTDLTLTQEMEIGEDISRDIHPTRESR